MKASFSLAAVLLAVGPAIASPVDAAVNGVLPGTPSVLRGLEEAQEKVRGNVVERAGKLQHEAGKNSNRADILNLVCNADNVLRGLRNPYAFPISPFIKEVVLMGSYSRTQTASASAFCSTYLQSTSTVTATTIVPETTLVPVSTTVSVIATETETIAVLVSAMITRRSPSINNPQIQGYLHHSLSRESCCDSDSDLWTGRLRIFGLFDLATSESYCRSMRTVLFIRSKLQEFPDPNRRWSVLQYVQPTNGRQRPRG